MLAVTSEMWSVGGKRSFLPLLRWSFSSSVDVATCVDVVVNGALSSCLVAGGVSLCSRATAAAEKTAS